MPGPSLSYLMQLSQKMKPETLRNILTKATKSTEGGEYTRLQQSTSWMDLISSAVGVVTASIKTPTLAAQFFSQEGRKNFINNIANDPDFPKYLAANQELASCLLQHLFAENPAQAARPSRAITRFVEVLPRVIRLLQEKGCLKDVTNINDLGIIITNTIIQDASSSKATGTSLYESSSDIAERFLDMAASHPVATQNMMSRMAFSTKSPSHQLQMLGALKSINAASAKNVSYQGVTRSDLASQCISYRAPVSGGVKLLLDTPTESAMHQLLFDDLTLDKDTIPHSMHLEGFKFRNATLRQGFPPDNSCFVKCDFNFVDIEDGVSFDKCVIDAQSLKTLLPSLRVAKAEGKNVSLNGLRVVGDLSGLDLSFIDFSHVDLSGVTSMNRTNFFNATPNTLLPDYKRRGAVQQQGIPLNKKEVEVKRQLSLIHERVSNEFTANKIAAKDLSVIKSKLDRDLFVDSFYSSLSTFPPETQQVILYGLEQDQQTFETFVRSLADSQLGLRENIDTISKTVAQNPELHRQYQRYLAKDTPSLDPFTKEFLELVAPLTSSVEIEVLTTIAQENIESLSRKFDSFKGTKSEKASLLLEEIKTSSQFMFRKQVQEFKPQKVHFSDRHIESMRSLFIEIGCGPFLDTVTYESPEKNPPRIFGTILQKTLCALFPNLRNIFGKNTKFGNALASRSFLQIARLIVFSLTHPSKMKRILKDSMYVMDQIGWISWKDPRDITRAQKELTTKLVSTGIVSDFLNNDRLPALAFSTTGLFPNFNNAQETIKVGREFYRALEQTGVIQKIGILVNGTERARLQTIAPFIQHAVTTDLLSKITPDAIEFITKQLNVFLTSQNNPTLSSREVTTLIESSRQLAAILKNHNLVDKIEQVLLVSHDESVEILTQAIKNPLHLGETLKIIQEVKRVNESLIKRAVEGIEKSTRRNIVVLLEKYKLTADLPSLLARPSDALIEEFKRTVTDKQDLAYLCGHAVKTKQMTELDINTELQQIRTQAVTGTLLWYEPDQCKFDKVFERKKHDPQASINLNDEFNVCSFGNAELRGTAENPLSWTNVHAQKFDMWGAKIEHVKFDGSTLTGYSNPVTSQWCFRGASFDHASISNCSLNRVSLRQAYMQDVKIIDCEAQSLELTQADMAYATLQSSHFDKTSFKKTNLYGAYLEDCTVKDSDLSHAQCHYTVFKCAFKGNTNFEEANLENATFAGSHFHGHVKFARAILVNTSFDNISLDKDAVIDLNKATISEATLKQLQSKFPKQIINAESALIIPNLAIKSLRSASTTTPDFPEVVPSERGEKYLKGRLNRNEQSRNG